ncbi:hypothetical protein U9M48_034877 [Paspalum notatum var. saurae]|uniref:Uncharacterized protein n=1 Tax=Paspalum notatum var. saurae TaxID=547442 RepID=A0AAQ3UDY2_PASNO
MATMLMMPTKRTGEGMTIEKHGKDEEVVTGDGWITQRPKTKDEEKRAMFEEEVAGDGSGITERPNTDDKEVAGDGSGITERPKTDEEEEAGDGSGITERPKRKILARYPKEYVEFMLGMGPPTTYPVWSDERLEKVLPERRAHIRAEPQELAAYAQKQIYRYQQMKEQYPNTGYADIELSDLEDDDIVEIDELRGTDA